MTRVFVETRGLEENEVSCEIWGGEEEGQEDSDEVGRESEKGMGEVCCMDLVVDEKVLKSIEGRKGKDESKEEEEGWGELREAVQDIPVVEGSLDRRVLGGVVSY